MLSSLVLSTLAQPVGVLATQLDQEKVHTREGLVKEISNPNLMNISSESIVTQTSIFGNPTRWQAVEWNQGIKKDTVEGNKVGFTGHQSVTGGGKFSLSNHQFTVIDNKSINIKGDGLEDFGVGQYVATEIGKEYTFSIDYTISNSAGRLGFTANGIGYGSLSGSSVGKKITFVADKEKTFVQFFYAANTGITSSNVDISNITATKSNSQVAIEELQQLLPTFFDQDGNLGSEITATDLAQAQTLLNKVSAGTEKNKLQVIFNQATELLNQRTALAQVSELFEYNNVNDDFIKNTVTQTTIDNVEALINKVTDTEKFEELNTYLSKAQELFNQNQAAIFLGSLFEDNNPENPVKDTLTQAMIDEANELISKITNEERKVILLQVSDRLQNILNERIEEQNNQIAANEAVNGLFKDGNPASGAIVDGLTQSSIDQAMELTNKVKDEEKKSTLLTGIEEAQTLLTERLIEEAKVNSIREAISALFQDGNSANSIRENLKQEEINQVMSSVQTIKDSTIQTELTNQIAKAQAELNALNAAKVNDAESAVNALFHNDDPSTEAIKGGLTQEMINQATVYTNEVVDADIKAALEANIAIAQILLDERIAETNRQNNAQEAVNGLFVENNPGTGSIISSLTQENIDVAQSLIDLVTAPSKKEALQNTLNTAQNLLTKRLEEEARQKLATEAVSALFENNDPTTNSIAKELTQEEIDAAEVLVDKVTDSIIKAELLANIAIAEELLEQRNIENNLIAAAEKEVNALFQDNDPKNGIIVEGLTQAHIDTAKLAAHKVQTESKKNELLEQIETAQKELYKQIIEKDNQEAAYKAVNELFEDNNPALGIIKDGLTQEAIDAAKELVALVADKDKKADLLSSIKDAENALNNQLTEAENTKIAEEAVNGLFKDNDPTTETNKADLTQEEIDAASSLVNNLTNEDKKAELLAVIEIVQKELDAQVTEDKAQQDALDALNALYKKDTIESGSLKESTTQTELDAVKELIGKITDEAKKEELETLLADAQALFTQQLDEMLIVNNFNLGKDNNVTGTLSKDIASIKLTVNGTEFTGGTISNGTFKFYAKGGKIKSVTDVVTISGFNKAGDHLITKNVKVVDVMVGELSVADFKVGLGTNLTGTFSEDIKSIKVDVDGKVYKGGTLSSNGTFKFYFKGNVTNINQVAVISGFDADGYEIARKRITLLPQTPGEGYINPAPFVLTEDSNITGTYSYDVKTIEVFVDGVKYEGGTISGDGTFKFYARSIVNSKNQTVEIVAYGVDGTETGRNFIPILTPEIGSGTLTPNEFTIGKSNNVTGSYTGDIASVRVVVDGVEFKGGTVKDGEFRFYASGKITKDSKDVKILGYDLRGNLLTEEVVTVVDPNAVPEVTPDPENQEEETLPTEELPLETIE